MNRESKIALVTAGGSGIGLAVAEKFVQNNIHTIIVGRDQQKLLAAGHKLEYLCKPLPFDLNDITALPVPGGWQARPPIV
jgi:NADP-dependent 3-hydroxy acid dehydrogenase YdfG